MKILRVGIFALLAFAVLSFGAVEEWSQAVVEVGFAILLVIWAFRVYSRKFEQISVSPLLLPLAAFALVVLIQLAIHRTASIYHTRVEFQILLVYLILLLLLPQAFYRTRHWKTMVWFLMVIAFCVSGFGILQNLTFNGKLYWIRAIRPGSPAFGPFVNRNHFAGFAELLIPIALVPLVMGKVRRERLFAVALLGVVPIVALFLSASRGGILAFLIQIVVLAALLALRKIRTKHMLVGGALILTAMLAVSWIGVEQLLRRFQETRPAEVASSKRLSMTKDTFRIFLDHPVIGTGLGTIQLVFPPYETNYDAKIVNHAHNDYAEALAETGVLGGLCCLWFLGVLLAESLRNLRDLGQSFAAAVNLSGLVACCGLLVHSLVDFNLHIPSNAMLFFLSAHLATARPQSSSPEEVLNKGIQRSVLKEEVG